MTSTLEPSPSPTVRTPGSIGHCVLRVCNGEHHGKIVRLNSDKPTIGSGLDCTLRLVAPGIHPMHCLLIAGENGVAIRRWSDGTLLNGKTFENAWLQPGDQLRVGPVELEWVGFEKPETKAAVELERVDAGGKTKRRSRATRFTSQERNERLRQRKRFARARRRMTLLRRRARKADRTIEKLSDQLVEMRRQLMALSVRPAAVESAPAGPHESLRRLEEELRQQRLDRRVAETQAEAQSRMWADERRRLEATLDAMNRRLAAEQENTARMRALTDHVRGLADQSNVQWRQATQELAAKQAVWQKSAQELENARNEVDSLRKQIATLQREMGEQTETARREIAEHQAGLRRYESELTELRGMWQSVSNPSNDETVSLPRGQWESLNSQYEKVSEAARAAEQSLARSEADLASANQRLQEAVDRGASLERELNDTTAAMRDSQANAQRIETELRECENRYREVVSTNESERQQWHSERETLTTQLVSTREELARFEAQWQAEKSLLEMANARIGQLESEAAARQTRFADVSRDASQINVELDRLRQQLAATESERDRAIEGERAVQQQLTAAVTQVDDLARQIESLRVQTTEESQRGLANHEQLSTLEQRRDELSAKVEQLTGELEQTRQRLEMVAGENRELATSRDTLRNQLAGLQSEFEQELARVREANQADPSSQPQASQPETGAEREEFEYERTRWNAHKEAWEAKLKQRSDELDRWQRELQSAQQTNREGGDESAVSEPSRGEAELATSQPVEATPEWSQTIRTSDYANPLFQEAEPEIDRRGMSRRGLPDVGYASSVSNEEYASSVSEPEHASSQSEPAPWQNAGEFREPDSLESRGDSFARDEHEPRENEPGQSSTQFGSGPREETPEPSPSLSQPFPVRDGQTMIFDPSVVGHRGARNTSGGEGGDVWQRLNQAGLLKPVSRSDSEEPADSGELGHEREEPTEEAANGEAGNRGYSSSYSHSEPERSAPVSERPFQPKMPSDDEEESIEDYMARLLKRVRGESSGGHGSSGHGSGGHGSSPAPKAAPTPSYTPETRKEAAKPVEEVVAAPVATVSEEEYVPKCQAPESQVDLKAMRELAMNTARTALNTSADQRRRKTTILSVLGLAGCAGATAVILLGGVWYNQWHQLPIAGGTAIGAAFFLYQLMPRRRN